MINIHPFTIPLFGSFAVHGYGILLAIGLTLACRGIYRSLQQLNLISFDDFTSILSYAVVIGVAGGRALHLLEQYHTYGTAYEMLRFWQGGLSISGGLTALCLYLPFALWRKKIPLFPTLDVVGLYAPLIHAFGRLGCLSAGCCFGCATQLPWAILYRGPAAEAPLGIPLHPTQAYSALIFFILFFALYTISKRSAVLAKRPGLLLGLYFIGACSERFCIDFLRNDRHMSVIPLLSLHQLIALGLGMTAVGMLLIHRYTSLRHSSTSR